MSLRSIVVSQQIKLGKKNQITNLNPRAQQKQKRRTDRY